MPPVVPPVGCFGLTATVVASGLTHTVHLAATQLHDRLCVKNAVSYTVFFHVHDIFQHCGLIFPSPQCVISEISTIMMRRR